MPYDEARRLDALRSLGILDSTPDAEFDALAQAASLVCETPIALISLVDADRQWLKANIGLRGVHETTRDVAFCAHTILSDELLEVPDATQDARFADNALVTGSPDIRFYAGAPLCLSDGSRVGSLCVIDRQPRHLDGPQRDILRNLARAAACALESFRVRRLQAQTALDLHASEERLRRLYEVTPAMLHSTDSEGRLLTVSDAWLDRMGYARNEVIGRRATDFLTAQSRAYDRETVLPKLLATGRCTAVEYQVVTKSGEIIDVLLSATSDYDPRGRMVRGVAVVEDVTMRRQAERALIAERLRLANLIEGAGLGTFECDLQTGAMRFNARSADIVGRQPDQAGEFTIAAWRARLHPDDLAGSDAAFALHLAGETEHFHFEGRTSHAGGHWLWVQLDGTVMTRARDGRPELMFGSLTDIDARRRQEEALRKSELFLEQTGRVAGVGGWELDLVTGAVQWSVETFRVHGLEPGDQLPLAEAIEFYSPEARPVIHEVLSRAAASGEPWDLELPFIRADGRRIWVRSVGSALMEGGKPVRLTGAIQDVTAKVAERAALSRANERLELATGSGGIGVWDWYFDTDSMVWDAQMCRLYGIDQADEAQARVRWKSMLHPADRPRAEQAISDAIAQNIPYDAEFRVIWPDGSLHWLKALGLVHDGEHGAPRRMVGVNWDITRERRLTAELAEQHDMLRVTLQSIADGVITTDAARRVVWLNPAAERLTGWPAADAAGRELAEVFCLIDEESRRPAAEVAAECSAWERPAGRSLLISRDGHEYGVEESEAPIRNAAGEVLGAVLVFHDVTQQRQQAERELREAELRVANAELDRLARHFAEARNIAEQASRAKTRFLASMSHELRTPLNGILGYAQLLRMDGGLTAAQAERVEAMLGAGTHLLEMISCVLDLSEIESGSAELQMAPVDLRSIADAALTIVRPAAEAKHMALSVAVAADVPARVLTDPARLRQILLNLLGNAVKFTARGSVELRVGTTAASPAMAPRLRFEVVDTGPGVRADQRHLLFGEFERLDAGAAGPVEGSGLGLSLSKRLASLMGGALGHADNPGGGSVFWLELPLAADTGNAVTPPARATDFAAVESVPPAKPARHRVLVVDDVAMNRDIAGAFIRSASYDVVYADGGEAAVAAAAGGDFVAVLMDVRMPGMDGLEATRRIRALGGARGSVPIVALTAQVFTEQIEACRQAGMDTHVAKPFTLETLLGAIRRGMEAAQSRAPTAAVPPPPAARPQAMEAALGADLPILDRAALDRTAAVLKPEAVVSYLHSLAGKAEALQLDLRARGDIPGSAQTLANSAHAIAGSAGMFGFDRLVFVARHFERAAKTDPAQAAALADDLDAALKLSIVAMRGRAYESAQITARA
jgi:PAS domain S-box-containing protein